MRTFEITLSVTPSTNNSSWTVERVRETNRGGRETAIPELDTIVASTADMGLPRACDRIDKWLCRILHGAHVETTDPGARAGLDLNESLRWAGGKKPVSERLIQNLVPVGLPYLTLELIHRVLERGR